MGNCSDSKQIRVQNETIELMRKDLETTKEILQCLMTNCSPDKAEGVEQLCFKALNAREHKELSDLILLQREVDKLKTDLKMDPNLVLTDIEKEIRNLQHQISALKAVQSLTNEFTALPTPPFATFVSIPHNNIAPKKKSADSVDGNEVWQVRSWKENSFRIEIDGIVVLTNGLYQIFSATQTNGSYYSGSRCILRINNEDVVNVPQAESGATYLHGLFLIEAGSVISMFFLDASKKFKLSRYLPPTVLDIVLMKA